MASAASTSRPVVWPPASTTAKSSPSWRTSFIRAKGLIVPVWPPAPPATAMAAVGDVVQGDSPPAMDALDGVAGRTLRGEHDRHLVLLDQLEIAGVARVRAEEHTSELQA